MAEMLKFPCTGCGICCTRVWLAKGTLSKEEFPFDVKKDGSCEMLGKDNTCKVYENRPDICRIDKMYEKEHSKTMTRKEAYKRGSY